MEGSEDLRFRVLGPVSAWRDGAELDLGGPQQRLLLALLVVEFGNRLSIDRLIESIWSDVPPTTARKTLQVYVSHLRSSLGEGCIQTAMGGYQLVGGQVDARTFEERAAQGRQRTSDDPYMAVQVLAEALGMWAGSPYAGFEDNDTVLAEIRRLEELRVSTLEARISAELASGAGASLIAELESLALEYPLRERFRAQLMLALYRADRQADALRVFRQTRDYMIEELGIEPGRELWDVEQRILDQDPDLVPSSEPIGGIPIRAIRGYELRDLVRGRVGRVYRAFDRGSKQTVAVKVIPPKVSGRRAYLQQFESTAQLLSRLEHSLIVPLLDYWREPEGAYLVSDWMPGGSLRSALGEGRPWAQDPTLTLIDQVGEALSHAHRSGVTHGGLKPENVLFDDAGAAHLGDFPILPWREGPYVAPEVRQAQEPTSQSDIYAFGLIIHELLTGSLPPDGRPSRLLAPELQDAIKNATATDPRNRFDRVEDLVRAVRRATGSDVTTVAPFDRGVVSAIRNPYKGLRAFQEADAADFFGREAMVDDVIQKAAEHPLLTVVGPSGCGKSSLVKAGLIPALRDRARGRPALITEMYPGRYPFEELERALLRVAGDWPEQGMAADLASDRNGLSRLAKQILPDDDTELILIIDQFEELFSLLVDEDTRVLFLQSLATAADEASFQLVIVLTLRADFFDRPLEYGEFGKLLEEGVLPLATPSRRELAQAVSRPAHRAGLELEEGLVSEIVSDVADQPGALPLMQFALTEMVERSETQTLTIEDYHRRGGVGGAIGARAEEIYQQQSESARLALQQAFLRLVHVDEHDAYTRRRVRRSELASLNVDQTALSSGLQAFASARLLTFDRDPITRGPTVEVAHEA
ncbi:MAG TPA: BTAD domain-containing putative transcriptional regulator, partial [Acidimicrobiia bacterium]|nr:BTAD domain-containing putative transcriptional regulator [Acidimicrobiia bacterium]